MALQAVGGHRRDAFAIRRFGLALNAEHARLARAVNIGVENADFRAFGRERQREIHRHRGLAHTALARRHGNDVLDVAQRRERALHLVRMDAATEGDRG
jgi:uncharacterized alpha-E superfamily protein